MDDSDKRRVSRRVLNSSSNRKGGRDSSSRGKGKKRSSVLVDFVKLEMRSLSKYRKHFKLNVRPEASKTELIQSVRKHFAHHPRLRDQDVISSFLFANRKYAKKLSELQQQQQSSQDQKDSSSNALRISAPAHSSNS